MPERGSIRLNIQRGAGVGEFAQFLTDLEGVYLALHLLPNERTLRRYRGRQSFYLEGLEWAPSYLDASDLRGSELYPLDQLEIVRISIQSPGWVEVIGSLNPLQQIREYLKDRHERKKDRAWRCETEKERALLEIEILRLQTERDRIGVIGQFYELLERMEINPEERQRLLWERLGAPMMRLSHHQDTGLLGSQDDDIDTKGDETGG
ncbi:hypothetical protein [Sphingomonas sp.]|uniref:hypothetical protein n=1 Tax=Sphingomonas sp. TaxID=28214 RepID=UPI001B2A145B|nr:hypothetical protein [Sphingomonas sp.]MBO9714243.1 hypothetical protein [Sphingomonas sp.]